MRNQLSFWIGFFSASLLAVPLAVGIWFASEEFARQIAAILFIAISLLILFLAILLIFRDQLLKKVLGRHQIGLDQIAEQSVELTGAIASRDAKKADAAAKILAKRVAGWYAWTTMYKWVFSTTLSLLIAFGTFAGAVLVFRQVELLDSQNQFIETQTGLMSSQTDSLLSQTLEAELQNELVVLSLISDLRNQMLDSSEQKSIGEILNDVGFFSESGPIVSSEDLECSLDLTRSTAIQLPVSEAVLAQLSIMALSEQIGERVIQALSTLEIDSKNSVASGARRVLEDLGHNYDGAHRSYSRFTVYSDSSPELSMWTTYESSILSVNNCENCSVSVDGSIIFGHQDFSNVGTHNLILFLNGFGSEYLGMSTDIVFLDVQSEQVPDDAVKLISGPYFKGLGVPYLINNAYPDVCTGLAAIGAYSKLLEFEHK